ncbi:MAG: DsbA family protein [Bacteroidetes bacterium]|nr:DsbA family protein [Bacteroidota bacterium]
MSKLRTPVTDKDDQTGNLKGKAVLVEYGDYQCPHCGHAFPLVKKLLQEMGEDLHFVFRNFPLSEVHPLAYDAALVAEAAGRQGKFWEMHDMIFKRQITMTEDSFAQYVSTLKLDPKRMQADIADQAIIAKVEDDFESGVKSGVNGTPTFFLNGERLNSYDGSYESLKEAVEAAIT